MKNIKKRRDNIKKIFFLITIISIYFFSSINIYAESTTFYEAEYIDNIYMSKYEYSTQTTYFQTARFFRNSQTNDFAYCIEPLIFFKENSNYHSTLNPNNFSTEQVERIKKIAHFGYGYKNHTDQKWYAITQMMIWKESGKDIGKFFFTDSLNGKEINPYENEIAEIENLIEKYDRLPMDNNQTFQILEGQTLGIHPKENINDYKSKSQNVTINNGTIEVSNLKEGEYEFTLIREEEQNEPTIFYQANNSQTLMKKGGITDKILNFKVKVINSKIIIHKVDKDTKSNNPQGKAELNHAIYGLYDKNNNLIQKTEIMNNQGIFENLNYGTYYIKELEPGKGYTLNPEVYEITITTKEYQKEITLDNKVIEKKIKIIKKFGEENNLTREKNIDFEIYNHNNELIKTISTDENGEIILILPYGEYKVIQINSSNGYEKVEPFTITIEDEEEKTIELIDYKIPIPNTHTEKNNLLFYLIKFIRWIL